MQRFLFNAVKGSEKETHGGGGGGAIQADCGKNAKQNSADCLRSGKTSTEWPTHQYNNNYFISFKS